MDEVLREFAAKLNGPPGVGRAEVAAVLAELGMVDPPDDYLRFMKIRNGGDGFLSDDSIYLYVYPVELLAANHHGYGFPQFAPHRVLFACDGDGSSFSFAKDPADRGVYAAEFTSLVDAVRVAPGFLEFLGTLGEGRWPQSAAGMKRG